MFRFGNCVAVLATILASSTAGGEPLSDHQIGDLLKRAYAGEYRLREAGIDVSIFNGSVTLKGTVKTFMDKDAAERMARKTSGVRSVLNMIEVDAVKLDDNRIAEDIRGRVARSSFIRSSDLKIDVSAGVVELSGTVDSWEESEQIERVAREVRGVRDVINRLEIVRAASQVHEDLIAGSVAAALARDAYLAGYPIEVVVASGVVRLSGEVPNLFQKERAASESMAVPGVRRVDDDQLVVASQAMLESLPIAPTDADLQSFVYEELRADPRVPVQGIEVISQGGEIRLLGTVDSLFAGQTAARVAREVFGVAHVHNELEVQATTRDDEQISEDLRSNFASDSMLDGQNIVIAVKNGSATLSGEVSSNPIKYHALRVASRVSGVREIANNLRVTRQENVSDESIKQQISARLAANAATRAIADRISVSVDDGDVTLSGSIDRWVEAVEITRIAWQTEGVRTVTNQLQRRN